VCLGSESECLAKRRSGGWQRKRQAQRESMLAYLVQSWQSERAEEDEVSSSSGGRGGAAALLGRAKSAGRERLGERRRRHSHESQESDDSRAGHNNFRRRHRRALSQGTDLDAAAVRCCVSFGFSRSGGLCVRVWRAYLVAANAVNRPEAVPKRVWLRFLACARAFEPLSREAVRAYGAKPPPPLP
jgi:hypothetical protein